jgi:hypothetical protein
LQTVVEQETDPFWLLLIADVTVTVFFLLFYQCLFF